MYKNDNSALDVLELFPFDQLQCYFVSPYNLVMRIQMMCNSQEPQHLHVYFPIIPLVGERSGSVVECLTRDRRAAGSSLTGVTALWSLSKTHLS